MDGDHAREYWRARLAGFAQPTRLGVERAATPADEGWAEARLSWTPEHADALVRAAGAAGVRPRDLMCAGWAMVLAAHAGEQDVVFGVDDEGSEGSRVRPLRVRMEPAQRLGAYLDGVREAVGTGAAHAVPAPEELARCADLTDPGAPLFDTVLHRVPAARPPAYGIEVTAVFDGPEPGLRLVHAVGRIDATDARRLIGHLDRVLRALAAGASRDTVGSLETLSSTERDRVVREWNDTGRVLGEPACLHELFEDRAVRAPGALAVVQGADRLTYAELDTAADALAARLAAEGVGRGDTVALSLRRTVHCVVALLGVLKAGAAYAPVDPELPAERVRGLVETLGARVVLTDPGNVPETLRRCRGLDALRAVLWLGPARNEGDGGNAGGDGNSGNGGDGEGNREGRGDGSAAERSVGGVTVGWALARPADGAPEPVRAHPDDPAYTIFTSGSTGTPKGVMVQHAPAVNLIRWVNETYRVGPADQVLFVASLSFDLSVYDVFGMLAAGGSVRVATAEEVRDPQRLLTLLDREPITFWDSAPAALQQLEPFLALREQPAEHSLRLVFVSGDWVPLTLPVSVRQGFAEPEFVALGGATEAAIWSNCFPVTKVDPAWSSVPYGRPITNARYYVLDAAMRPAPVGAPGDLYIGGSCLATGYHGAPGLTAAKFVPDPFGGESGGRLYRTGDRARFWADGTIEFLGRQDQQVKIRGHRVELGEIEACLAACAGVASAVAAVHGRGADALLTGYVVPRPGVTPDPAGLRAELADRLPPYMVPAQVLVLRALPTTANGKLDRAALPAPDFTAAVRPPYVAPGTPVEEAVAEIWADFLGVERLGADDNFFDLGGHSLLITQVVARLRTDLGIEVMPLTLLEHQTVGSFAAEVEALLLDEDTPAGTRTTDTADTATPPPDEAAPFGTGATDTDGGAVRDGGTIRG